MKKGIILNRDSNLSLLTAKGFYDQAIPFLEKIDSRSNYHELALADLGGLIASATTMALSLEIYIKTLYIMSNVNVPHNHNLWRLFEGLPSNIKDHAIQIYNAKKSIEKPENLRGIQIKLTENSRVPQKIDIDDEDLNRTLSMDLESILKKSEDAFINWRYLYEQPEQNKPLILQYDFVCMAILVKTLHEIITSAINAHVKKQ